MKNIPAITVCAILMSLCICRSSNADNAVSKVPLSAASMATGAIVGTPIAIVRKTKSQFCGCLKEYKKDSNAYKFWGTGCAAIVAAPAGLIKGSICGAKNAVVHSVQQPFSRDAFSLGKLQESPPAPKPRPSDEKPESQPWGTPK
jgi:hypothetical protein